MFDFSYTNNYSVGNLILDYQNLKISLLDRTTKQSKDIKSLLANTLIVREKNLPEQRRYRNGKIYFVRDKKKINYQLLVEICFQWHRINCCKLIDEKCGHSLKHSLLLSV